MGAESIIGWEQPVFRSYLHDWQVEGEVTGVLVGIERENRVLHDEFLTIRAGG